jgi:hypothetical protein
MQRNRTRFGLLTIFLTLVSATFGQTFRGGIAGSVADTSAAAIPEATVKIEHTGTGLTREMTTSTTGDFNFPDLPTGIYTVTVSRQGFQTQKIEKVDVAVGRITSLPITLSVASQAATVEVQAVTATLETNESALNAVVNTRAVQEIPLNGRDYRQLLLLTPGFNQAFSMNGNRSNQNNWQIDGVDNNDFWHNAEAVNQGSISGVAGVLLPIDAIDQFNQQASGAADFGRNPGSMVNVVLKSGTNDVHGSIYYFNRNDALAATNPFQPPEAFDPAIKNHNYGFSVGGPIWKNRTFFFLTYEKQKFLAGNQLLATVPSDAWVAKAEALMSNYGVAPNQVMLNVLNTLWPSVIKSPPATINNFFSADKNDYKSDNGVINIQHNINDNHTLYARAFLGTGDAVAYAGSVFREYFQAVPSRQSNYALIWNGVLTPRLVNQTLVGVNYFLQTFNDESHGVNLPALGFNTGVTNPSNFGAPTMSMSGFSNALVGATPYLGRIDTTGHITDNLSYNFGSHALKIGGEIRKSRLDVFYYREARGSFSWDGTQGPWAGDPADVQTRALADFLGGYIGPGYGSKATGDPQRNYDVNTYEWWVQDNWQVNPRLNVNYGVRYTYNGRMHEAVHKKGISIFRPDLAGAEYPGFGFVGNEIDALYPADYNNFGPRFGFAYTPKRGGSTVIRGGYGVFYDLVNGNLFIDNRADGFAGRGLSRNPAGPTPIFSVTNSQKLIIEPGLDIFGGSTGRPPFGAYTINQDIRSPYVQQFNLNLQQQLGRLALLQVGYIGNVARKLIVNNDINPPAPGIYDASTIQQRRPYNAQFPNVAGITEITSAGNSHYHGLQGSLRTQSWHGLIGQVSYTYGHAWDIMSGVRNNGFTNFYDWGLDYGRADFDIRHTFSSYIVYDIPQFGQSLPRLTKGWQVNSLITADSGFPFSVYASTDYGGTRNFRDRANLTGDPFANVTQLPKVEGRWTSGYQYYNPAAFTDPAPGEFGNTKRNQFTGPGFGAVDFSIFKNTPITERINTQFRVEIFNIFNRLNLGGACNSVGCGSANGVVGGTRNGGGAPGIGYGEPRNVQLALKIIF